MCACSHGKPGGTRPAQSLTSNSSILLFLPQQKCTVAWRNALHDAAPSDAPAQNKPIAPFSSRASRGASIRRPAVQRAGRPRNLPVPE
eukprot:21317-Prymnesium_polylepis.1